MGSSVPENPFFSGTEQRITVSGENKGAIRILFIIEVTQKLEVGRSFVQCVHNVLVCCGRGGMCESTRQINASASAFQRPAPRRRCCVPSNSDVFVWRFLAFFTCM